MSKRDILYVDDEMDNLIVFEATFEQDFNVHIATSGPEALEMMSQRLFPLVVADQRMPGMTGAEFLEAARNSHPQTKRVMLTGYADSRAMLDAINRGQLYYFIQKPWERDFVHPVLMRAIEAYDLSMSNAALTERMVLMDRCATLGRSAAAMAHEFGNQLCMLPLLEFIEDNYANDADLTRLAGLSRTSYTRLVDLINEVKAFVRFERDAPKGRPIRLANVVHELVDFLRYDRKLTNVSVSLNLRTNPYIIGNNIKLQQVLINLLKNAADALGNREDGLITISLDCDQQTAVLVVGDNGPGMTPEVASRIWEPFFTTKGTGGTGLGLDVAKSIITGHGGTIDCETQPGQGARFVISLPIATRAEGEAGNSPARPANVALTPIPWEPPSAAIGLVAAANPA